MEYKFNFIESVRFVLQCYENSVVLLGVDPWYTRADGAKVEMALRGINLSSDKKYEDPEVRMMAALKLILREKELGADQFLFVV